MSYDLYLLKKDQIGDDPAAAYEQLEEREEREPTLEEEAELRRLATALQATNPGADLAETDRGFFQLGYETERPVVVDIGADEISMSWSYGAEDARAALTEVRKYLPVFESFGYVAYDPQLERVFDPDRDSADAEQTHDYVRGRLTEAYGDPPRERRPWWKRLLG